MKLLADLLAEMKQEESFGKRNRRNGGVRVMLQELKEVIDRACGGDRQGILRALYTKKELLTATVGEKVGALLGSAPREMKKNL